MQYVLNSFDILNLIELVKNNKKGINSNKYKCKTSFSDE